MKNFIYILFLSLSILSEVNAQTFDVDTIMYSGNEDKRINFVFLGDGYTVSTQNDFIADVNNFSNYLFSIKPYSNYKNSLLSDKKNKRWDTACRYPTLV